MSEHHYDFPKTTVTQVILAALGGLIAPLIVIILIVNHVLHIQASYIEDPVTPDSIKAANAVVDERIKPVAVVALSEKVSATGAGQAGKTGEEIVNAVCSACHGAGVMGSPKIGDKAAWAPRIAQGYDILKKNATNGIRAMPAKGGSADLTEVEVARAVAYLANKGGAKFTAP